jgi:hypothetical protein
MQQSLCQCFNGRMALNDLLKQKDPLWSQTESAINCPNCQQFLQNAKKNQGSTG